MKMPLTKHYCISKECGWEETTHKILDGINCPKCSGPVNTERIKDELKYRHKAECLVCEHSEMVYHESKEDYQEVRVCPKCNGALVDVFKLCKYQNNLVVEKGGDVSSKLEVVFQKACNDYLKSPRTNAENLAQIRQLGEMLIQSKDQHVIQMTIEISSNTKSETEIINLISNKFKESVEGMNKL